MVTTTRWSPPLAEGDPRGHLHRWRRGRQPTSSSRCRLTPTVTNIRRYLCSAWSDGVVAHWVELIALEVEAAISSLTDLGPPQTRFTRSCVCPNRHEDRVHANKANRALHIVGEHRQAHLGRDVPQPLRPEVGRAHPVLERGKDVLDGPAAHAHGIRPCIKALLHGVEHALALPAADAALASRRAPRPCRAGLTGCGVEVDAQHLALLVSREAVGQPLAQGTPAGIAVGLVDEVVLAPLPFRPSGRGVGLGNKCGDAGRLTGQDLTAVVVAAISDDGRFAWL